MEPAKLLMFFDIDGTLVHHHKVSRRTVRMLSNARKAGHLLFINTGRSRGFLPGYLLEKTIWDGYVCGGGYAEFHGKVLMDERLGKELVERICRFSEQNSIKLILEGIDNCYTLGFRKGKFVRFMTANEAVSRYAEMKVTKVTFLYKLTNEQKLLFESDLNIIQMPTYTEAYKKGFSKANGMRLIANELGIPKQNIAAFGDSKNDTEMLLEAGIRVVMRQAPPSIKSLATIVTRRRRSGVAEGLKKIIASYK